MTLARWSFVLWLSVWTLAIQAQPPTAAAVLSLIGTAEQAVAQGDDRAAEAALSRIPSGSADGMQLARIQLVRAEIGLIRRQPGTMLRALPPTSQHVPALAARMESLRARAYFLDGDPAQAVAALVERERWLRSPDELADNREDIWRGLLAAPLPGRTIAALDTQPPMVRGWLDAARVLQQGPTGEAISAWSRRNPGHPASSWMAQVRFPGGGSAQAQAPPALSIPGLGAVGGRLAVLLPLSGSLGAAGSAARDGMAAAWFGAPAPRPSLRFYDTRGDAGAALVAWETAVLDGADLIVGPLTKPAVAIIARQGTPRPWIALNYVDQPLSGALQFGLAPEDEARAAAVDALASGRRQALALVPDNEWGTRALQAFTETFVSQGGRVLDSVRVKSGTQDFGDAMRQLLRLEGSRSRHQQLTQVLGVPSEFEPRPRQDANLLFAPLRAEEIRALSPQLAFFRAGSLTTYVISAAHSGRVDEQLEGLKLCDMPWVMSGGGAVDDQRARDALNFPFPVRTQPRLFALGRDAFELARGMLGGNLHRMQDLAGATGRLQVAPGGRVIRTLDCSRVVEGRAVAGT
ncbi:penicillin-binding protein activator [Panacagrimonas sp.]|uniref:penicillin-binding protein activator n=1 Tax=Panacagrimonas sp. TaxID=2480088 RepID=UPI003B51D042